MNSPANHLGALTGMRFFAALAVVVGHLMGRFGLPNYHVVLGGAAVSFFFVLSGFILTYVYQDQLTLSGVKKFYFKRWARIWPLHLVCLILSIYVINMTISNYGMLIVNLALLHSWVPDSSWVFSFNGVSWSISTEMFFYFMFPFFLIGGQKRFWVKYGILWVSVVGAVIGIQILAGQPGFEAYDFDRSAHVNPFLRLPEFCTGMGVGFIFFNRSQLRIERSMAWDTVVEILALGLIPAYSLTYRYFKVTWVIKNSPWGGSVIGLWVQYAGMMFVFAIIIYVFARSRGLFSRWLGSKALVFLGEISFALYMIHFLVILGMSRIDWSASSVAPWQLGALAIAISICLAAFLYQLVEMPAKTGLMSLYSGDFWKSLTAFPIGLARFIRWPGNWVAIAVLAMSLGALKINYNPLNTSHEIQDVIAASPEPYRDVMFGDQIRLMGVQSTPLPKGIELKMVWQRKGPLNRNQFMHFCDADGKIITQMAPEKTIYKNAELQELILETCFLPNAKLADENITQIGIGFYSKETDPVTNRSYPMLRASKGPLGMSSFRLYVIETEQLAKLRVEITNQASEESGDNGSGAQAGLGKN